MSAVGYRPQQLTARWEQLLGAPQDPLGVFPHDRCVALDDREEFPEAICAALDAAGLPRAYVPEQYGGGLARYDEVLAVMRTLARRDLTVAIAHGKTYLGAVSAWVGAGPEQAAALAAQVLDGTVVAWGLTEREHGSDLLAGEVTAVPTAGGYTLHGEKWLINNATRADLVCTLARTDPAGGPRGYSLLLVDKRRLPRGPGGYRTLPKVRTHGIRGADISGIAFDGAQVPADAVVGAPGAGLEIVLKSLQLTRTLCASLSLGAGDHALRIALHFAAGRRLYGRTVADLPQARHTLGEALGDHLAAEAAAIVTSRAIHTATSELMIGSAVVKYLVPTLVGEVIARLRGLLGARAFLSDVFAGGMFQKVERDHRIVGLFDGSTVVNLHALVHQFPVLARSYRRGSADEAAVAAAATLTTPLPPLDPGRLSLAAKQGCGLVQSLPAWVAGGGGLPPAVAALAAEVVTAAGRLHEELALHRPAPLAVPAVAFARAQRYAACYAAAAALRLWAHNHAWAAATADPRTVALWDEGLWLQACLHRLLPRISPGHPAGTGPRAAQVLARLVSVAETGDLSGSGPVLSLLPAAPRPPAARVATGELR